MSLRDAADLARDLGDLLAGGMAVPDALGRAAESAPEPWRQPLKRAQASAAAGSRLAAALRAQNCFSPLLVEGLQGLPDTVALARVAVLLEEADSRQEQVRSTLRYPFFLMGSALALIWLLYAFVGGSMNQLFQEMSLHLPFITLVSIRVGHLVGHPLFVTAEVLAMLATYAVLAGYRGSAALRLRLPMVGSWIRRSESITWLGWLDHFLASGVPVPEAMRLAASTSTDAAWKAAVEASARRCEKGETLGAAVQAERLLPSLAEWMLQRGQSQELPPGYLAGVASALQRELDMETPGNLAWLEMLGIGAAVFLVVPMILGFFLPLYQLIGALG